MKPCNVKFNEVWYSVDANKVIRQLNSQKQVIESLVPVATDGELGKAILERVKYLRGKKLRQEREAVMRSLGLTKVRGALGGTYWE